ncbi:MAG: type II CAAX endopeptidase family protein [Acidimicrobiia bacterium]|jgi:membrane protease YdiL (CAAX protease family)
MATAEMTYNETTSRKRGLGLFFALTFALTWGIAAILVLAPDAVERLFGPIGLTNPLYLLAVYAPAISGVVVAWRRLGRSGLKGYFARLKMIRMPVSNWLFLVVGVPAIVYAGAAVSGTLSTTPVFSPWYTMIPALFASMFLAGTWEELGWRGVAQPLLQRRFTPLTSGLIIGAVWALWHLPAFALSGTVQSAWAFGPYFVGVVAVSVIMAWFFNASNGSILVAWLVHFQLMNPLFADGQPWDSLFYVIAAVTIVIIHRKSMLRRGGDEVVDLQRPVDSEVSSDNESVLIPV